MLTGTLLCSNLPPHICVPTKSKGEKNNYNQILHTLKNARLALLISFGKSLLSKQSISATSQWRISQFKKTNQTKKP